MTIKQRIDKFLTTVFKLLLAYLVPKFISGELNFEKIVANKFDLFEFMKTMVRRRSFVREIRTVNVKKGKRRYTLLFVTTLDGTTRINLGRHTTMPYGYEEVDVQHKRWG